MRTPKQIIREEAAYSAEQTIQQLRDGEAAPEQMPRSIAEAERDFLAAQLGRQPTDKEWELYKETWERDMRRYNEIEYVD